MSLLKRSRQLVPNVKTSSSPLRSGQFPGRSDECRSETDILWSSSWDQVYDVQAAFNLSLKDLNTDHVDLVTFVLNTPLGLVNICVVTVPHSLASVSEDRRYVTPLTCTRSGTNDPLSIVRGWQHLEDS